MCTKQELQIILKRITAIYKMVYGENLVKVVLYGSYARGDYDESSDIDIVAIVKGEREQLQKDLKIVWETSSELDLEYNTIVSPTVIPYREYEQYRNELPYYRNIEQEGVVIA